ncbi:histidine kinase [Sporosarcina sp. P37]|uniref:sigma-54 interaction domain-containing protein n=1 Tax=unclassified Sporosarcina TaxID=2647733 RepID=UPI000A17A3D2|nr:MULTISPECIES: sigma 54-interacting transcriptional regulator [unclassified Sporosarcina]ARK25005.1 histidine kinase [Sporosarcina sp. P37]PID18151.1 histidine kinase [Sporosarcina sp. P35]
MTSEKESEKMDLSLESLLKILDYSSDEIYVLDGETKIVYVNRNCEKHYGVKKSDVLGRYNADFFNEGYWTPSVVPRVLEEKTPVSARQQTNIGAELLTRAFPILNKQNEIEYIVITATEIKDFTRLTTTEEQPSLSELDQNFTDTIIMNSKKMRKILHFCEKVAPTDSTVLVHGQSGTGKGVIAYHLHKLSTRKNEPFLNVNCAAIPEDLLESALFGYIAGSFTGAKKEGKIGMFEAADNGTIFLDEIGELALPLQAKVLQVIQDKKFIPVGSNVSKTVNVRIIAATNQDLLQMVQDKTFREDLFYRLNVIDIHMPSLAERRDDIIPLVYSFLSKFNDKYNFTKIISEDCLTVLYHYSWPGNVRQLENLMERLVITSEAVIGVEDLPEVILDKVKEIPELLYSNSLESALNNVTGTMVRRSYQKFGTSRGVAADLQISQSKASRLIREHCPNED